MALEEPEYTVVERHDGFEIRRYEPYLVAEVAVAGSMRGSDGDAFRILANYIFGGNQSDTRMSMTAPVESTPAQAGSAFAETRSAVEDGWTYSFVMERRYSKASLPVPNDERIKITERPARTMAVRRFSGRWTKDNVAENERALFSAVEQAGLKIVGKPVLARYDAPYKPWFMRRNEVMVSIVPEATTTEY